MVAQQDNSQSMDLLLGSADRVSSAEVDARNYEGTKSLPTHHRVRVQFDVEVTVADYIHPKDFTSEEKSNSWYTPTEYAEMKQESNRTIKLVTQGKRLTSSMIFQGLENRTYEASLEKKAAVLRAWLAVINEQKKQRASGIVDPDVIREEYKKLTRQTEKDAREQGNRDWLAVRADRKREQEGMHTCSTDRHLSRLVYKVTGKRRLQVFGRR